MIEDTIAHLYQTIQYFVCNCSVGAFFENNTGSSPYHTSAYCKDETLYPELTELLETISGRFGSDLSLEGNAG